MTRIFVYGTLLRGMRRARVLSDSAFLGPAIVKGSLWDFGPYPGMRQGDGWVVGEVFEVSPSTLRAMDEIEGFRAESPSTSLFLRVEQECRWFSSGDSVQVAMYVAQQPGGEHIPHGDYRRFCLERDEINQWIVSFGSNLGTKRLRKRVGLLGRSEVGELRGFQLAFNKRANQGTANANAQFVGGDNYCPAVAYELTPEQVESLDGYEGIPSHYLRVGV
ncbi:MAG: gamma-glutamylcyclotransferase, partial [Planctomycetes bacterium]|nr:gamma-glutamylcyclotransferase [Planctomycetota bacterium]